MRFGGLRNAISQYPRNHLKGVASMIRKMCFLLTTGLILGCSTVPPTGSPSGNPSAKSAASRAEEGRPYTDPFARGSVEHTGFIGQLPEDRYFEILGRADCDDWTQQFLVYPSQINNTPDHFRERRANGGLVRNCQFLMEKRFREGGDSRLAGADAVVFDMDSFRYLITDAWAVTAKKVHMDGWAIRFIDHPNAEQIHQRLTAPAENLLARRQIVAAAHWAAQNQRKDMLPTLLSLLPTRTDSGLTYGWSEVSVAAFKALHALDTGEVDAMVYWAILEAGASPYNASEGWKTRALVAHPDVQNIPEMAASALVCRGGDGMADRMEEVFRMAGYRQHRMAAAGALMQLDRKRFESLLSQMAGTTEYLFYRNRLKRYGLAGSENMVCPAKGAALSAGAFSLPAW
jgi:hypothetical protein